jgi:hypothetical protein
MLLRSRLTSAKAACWATTVATGINVDRPGHLIGQGQRIPEPTQPETKSEDGRCGAKGQAVGQGIEVAAKGRALVPAAATDAFGIGTFGGLPLHKLVAPLRRGVWRLVVGCHHAWAISVPTMLISRQVSLA